MIKSFNLQCKVLPYFTLLLSSSGLVLVKNEYAGANSEYCTKCETEGGSPEPTVIFKEDCEPSACLEQMLGNVWYGQPEPL